MNKQCKDDEKIVAELQRLRSENEALRNILRLCRPYMYEYASNTIDGAFDKLCETLDTEMKGQ